MKYFFKLVDEFFYKNDKKIHKFYLVYKNKKPRILVSTDHNFFNETFFYFLPNYTFKSKFLRLIIRFLYLIKLVNILPNVKIYKIAGNIKNPKFHGFDISEEILKLDFYFTHHEAKKIIVLATLSNSKKIIIKKSFKLSKYVKNEYESLEFINEISNINVPKCFKSNNDDIFAQEFLITTQSQIKLTSKHYHLLFELSKINKLLNFRNEISKILLSEYEIRRFKFCKNEINYLLEVLLKTRKKSFYFKSVLVHGDFAPWNIRCLENDKLLLIDWEFCNRNGLPFYDLYYYQFIILLTLNKKVSIDENKYSRLYLNKEESSDETKLIKKLAKLKVLVDINKKLIYK